MAGRLGMVIIVIGLCFASNALGQMSAGIGAPKLTLDDMRTPASPGFIVLGIEPSAIERPMTPKAIGLSLLSAASQGDLIPQDYAISVAPYWLFPHPALTFDDYYDANAEHTLLSNLSVSLATSRIVDDMDSAQYGTSMGFGIRTLLVDGKPSSELNNLRRELRYWHILALLIPEPEDGAFANLDDVRSQIDGEIEYLRNNPDKLNVPEIPVAERPAALEHVREMIFNDYLGNQSATTPDQVAAVLTNAQTRLAARSQVTALTMQAENKNKTGLIIEMAGALAAHFPHDSIDKGEIARWGIWITPVYRLEKPLVDFLAVGRFIGDETGTGGGDAFDIGARILYQSGDFALSGEFVQRARRDADNTQRLVGLLEYRVRENIILTATFGKDYNQNGMGGGDLISLLGINFGFGKNPILTGL